MTIQLLPALGLAGLTSVVGFSVGRITVPEPEKQSLAPTKSSIRSTEEKSSPSRRAKVSSTLVADLLAGDYTSNQELMGTIAQQDITANIERLLEEVGPKGLDRKLRSAIEAMLKTAMKEDPQSTVDWILAQQAPATRDFLFSEAMDADEDHQWTTEHFDELLAKAQGFTRPHEILKENHQHSNKERSARNDSTIEAIPEGRERRI